MFLLSLIKYHLQVQNIMQIVYIWAVCKMLPDLLYTLSIIYSGAENFQKSAQQRPTKYQKQAREKMQLSEQ